MFSKIKRRFYIWRDKREEEMRKHFIKERPCDLRFCEHNINGICCSLLFYSCNFTKTRRSREHRERIGL